MSSKEAEYKRMTEAPVAGLVMKLSVPTMCSMPKDANIITG